MSAFLSPFSICHITLIFPLTLSTFLLFVTVAMLSRYQSPVNCRSRNTEDNLSHKVNYRYYCHSPGLEFIYVPESIEGLPSQGQGDGKILKMVYFLENCIGYDGWWHCSIQGRCSYICRIKQSRKASALWRICSYHWMYNVIDEVLHKPRSL